jgi:hypothetical protein
MKLRPVHRFLVLAVVLFALAAFMNGCQGVTWRGVCADVELVAPQSQGSAFDVKPA